MIPWWMPSWSVKRKPEMNMQEQIGKSKTNTAWQLLRDLNEVCHFQTREGKLVGQASNSELKRWCMNKAFIINGESVAWDEEMDFPIFSVVLFPKNRRVTLL